MVRDVLRIEIVEESLAENNKRTEVGVKWV